MDYLLQIGLSRWDIIVLALVILVLPIGSEISNRTLKPRMERNEPGARMLWYKMTFVELWVVTAAIVWIWSSQARDWPDLGIGFEAGLWSWLTVGATALMIAVLGVQVWSLGRSPEAVESARAELEAAGMQDLSIMPQTQQEYRATQALGLTAGITEEVIFRGYLIWAFSLFVHVWIAAAMALALFVFMHRYQDIRGQVRVAIVGALMTALFLISGSLYPGIVLHAAIDLFSIGMMWRVRQV